MKEMIYIALSIIMFGTGILLGNIITKRPSVEKITVEKQVSVCDKAFSNNEELICFAKDACNGKLKDFNNDSLKTQLVFNCLE